MRDPSTPQGLSTTAVHAGEPRPETGPLDAPLVLSSAFAFADAETAAAAFRGENEAYIYGRWGTPTVDALEAMRHPLLDEGELRDARVDAVLRAEEDRIGHGGGELR